MGLKKTPLLRGNSTLKKSPLLKNSSSLKSGSKIKVKPKTEEQKKSQQEQWETDLAFYMEIWSERTHVCISCDKGLGNEPNLCFFEHGLPKSKYPQYRYNKENVSLICMECHANKEAGFASKKYQIKLDELKQKHLNGEL